jgi:hypothetical protein
VVIVHKYLFVFSMLHEVSRAVTTRNATDPVFDLSTTDVRKGGIPSWPEFIEMPAAALSVPLRALPLVAFKCPTARICVLWPLQPYLSVKVKVKVKVTAVVGAWDSGPQTYKTQVPFRLAD